MDKKEIKETRIYYNYNKVSHIAQNYLYKKELGKFRGLSPLKQGSRGPRL